MLGKNLVLFCVTDFCNAKCKFCSFWKTKRPTFPKKEELEEIVISIKKKLGCRILQITGGEPLTYPYLFDLIEIANRHRIITQLMTNGSLLSKEKVMGLKNAGLNFITISLDHYDAKVIEENRGIPNLLEKIKQSVKHLKKTKMGVSADITIAKHNVNDLEKIAEYAVSLGFDEVNFCFPVQSTDSTFQLGDNDPDVINISNEELVKIIDRLMKLKEKLGSKMFNEKSFLQDMRRYYLGRAQKFPCKGGENIFYLDNNLNVYRCMMKGGKLGSIKGKVKLLKNSRCYDCPLQCFREPSIYYGGIRSIHPILSMIKSSWKYLRPLTNKRREK